MKGPISPNYQYWNNNPETVKNDRGRKDKTDVWRLQSGYFPGGPTVRGCGVKGGCMLALDVRKNQWVQKRSDSIWGLLNIPRRVRTNRGFSWESQAKYQMVFRERNILQGYPIIWELVEEGGLGTGLEEGSLSAWHCWREFRWEGWVRLWDQACPKSV